MAITRRPGKIICVRCDNEVEIFFLSASNIEQRVEALVPGWTESLEGYVCGDHITSEVEPETPLEPLEPEAVEEETDAT